MFKIVGKLIGVAVKESKDGERYATADVLRKERDDHRLQAVYVDLAKVEALRGQVNKEGEWPVRVYATQKGNLRVAMI